MLFVVALVVLLLLYRCLKRRRALSLLARGADGVALWNRERSGEREAPTLSCWNFAKLDLRGIDFSRLDLRASNFAETRLAGANLEGADLRRCNFQAADLSGAVLRGANLRAANLDGANLTGTDLSGANLHRAWLRGVEFDDKTLWPDGFDPASTL